MRKDILKIARKEFQQLTRQYDKFIYVFVDDWRGFCFVFDTDDVRNCRNNCERCDLYQLLKNKKPGGKFFAGLKPASLEDKELFGPQNYLNCKTYEQYQNCYINFIVKNELSGAELSQELDLIYGSALVCSKGSSSTRASDNFRTLILSEVLNKVTNRKRDAIIKIQKSLLT